MPSAAVRSGREDGGLQTRRPASCRQRSTALGRLGAAAALLAIAGCAGPNPSEPVQPARTGVALSAPPEPRAEGAPLGGEKLREFYASIEGDLTARGRMRQDTAPADAPFTDADLVRDFERIALYDEYIDLNGRFVRAETPALLRRWEKPVRVAVMSGPSSSPEDTARDRANVAAFTNRLANLTGRDVALGQGNDVNFLVLFMNTAERTAFADQVKALYPSLAPAVMEALRNPPINIFCISYGFWDPAAPSTYNAVMVLIPAEHPAFTRRSCVQEEMAQAMGLPNDSDEARPSLFNDSKEFALLTEHDAILLRMLYDPRLRPGMTSAEVRPLLPDIARQARQAQLAAESLSVADAN